MGSRPDTPLPARDRHRRYSTFWIVTQISLAILGTALTAGLLVLALSDHMAALRHQRDTDMLTGVLSRRAFETQADAALGGSVADLVGRIGGEEFAVLHFGDIDSARRTAEQIRTALTGMTFDFLPRQSGVTASFGVADGPGGVPIAVLLRAADRELYRAKNAGRNRTSSSATESSATGTQQH